jgi:hypothetical protein
MVTGEEFSPSAFRRRCFVYYRIPLLRFQITPVFRDNTTSRLERYLNSNGLIPQPPAGASRWDVVRAVGVGIGHWRGDACILCNYLDQQDEDGKYVWLEWSKDHSDLAKQLWPMVVHAGRNRLYTVVPDLIHLAETIDDPVQLAESLTSQLVEAYVRSGQIHQRMEQHAQAVTYFTEALALQKDSVAAIRGRVRSYEALDQNRLAAAERQRLRTLDRGPDQ